MSDTDTITLTIDGRSVTAPAGSTVLEAARSARIYIPTLCYAPDLEPYGACRLCIVEIEGMRGMPTSCTTPALDGMVVHTESEALHRVRRMTVELLVADHPQDCLNCSANQKCKLQQLAADLGARGDRLRPSVKDLTPDTSSPFVHRDLTKCVLCGQCVRTCREVRGLTAIEIAYRGYESRIAPASGTPLAESVCEACGACVERCPTGALTAPTQGLPARKQVRTTCPYCGVGCGLLVGERSGEIVSVLSDPTAPANACASGLCVKGRFGLDFVSSDKRLTKPLIRKDGALQEAEWDEALDLVARRFREIREAHGPDALGGFSSAKCTNEENYLFQKFMRAVIGTNNVDHCARLCHSSTVAGLARAFGSGAMTNSIAELEHADCIFVTGSNTTEAHPVIALVIKRAVTKRGARLIVADPRRIDLTRFAEMHLRQQSGTDVALFNAMMHVILKEGLADEAFIRERTEGFEGLRDCVAEYTPELAAKITGVPAEDIRKAAIAYATAERGSIVYSMGITQHTTGTDNVLALANLAMLTGNVGRASTGVNPLRGQNNVQGACDMAALPNVLPGYQKVDDDALRANFEKAWGVTLPPKPGLTVVEMIHAAESGALKGLYIMGENPALSDPNTNRTRKALDAIEFMVVQDIFLTETAEYADVVLPSVCFAEKDGTFTNTERRVQRVRTAVPAPGETRQDWEILCDLAGRLGYEMRYGSPSDIMDEIAGLTPIYGGMAYNRIEKQGLQWPCPDRDHPGTPFLHKGEFKRGKGKFHVTPFREAAELPDEEYPYLFTTGRYLHHWHTGTLSRKTEGLNTLCPGGFFEIHPEDAAKEGLADGDAAELFSRRGKIVVKAKVTERSRRGSIFMAFHFWEAAGNVLTNDALDPIAKIPEFKVCAIGLRKA